MNSNIRHSFLGSVAVYGAAEGISRLLAFVTFPVLTHFFTSSEFGAVSLVSSLATFVALFGNCGINNAVHRYYLDSKSTLENKRSIVSSGLLMLTLTCSISVVVGLLILFFTPVRLINSTTETLAIVAFASVIPAQLIQYAQDIIRLYSTPWSYFIIAVSKATLGLILVLLFISYFGMGVAGYFFGFFAAYLLLVPFSIFFVRKDLTLRGGLSFVKPIMHFGSPFIVAGLAQWLLSSIDIWMLNYFGDASQVGIYSVALRLATIVTFFTSAFAQAWSPHALKLHAEEPMHQEIIGKLLVQLAAALMLVAASVSFLGKDILVWFIPAEYHQALIPLCILSFSNAIAGTVQVTALGMLFKKRSDLLAKLGWLCAVFAAILYVILVPLYGIYGAAVANMTTALILTGSYLLVTQSIHPLKLNRLHILRLVGFGIVMFVIAIGLTTYRISPILLLIKLCLIYVLAFVGARYDLIDLRIPFLKRILFK